MSTNVQGGVQTMSTARMLSQDIRDKTRRHEYTEYSLGTTDLRSLRCVTKLKTESESYARKTAGHCFRLVTWAVDTSKGVLFMCNHCFERYVSRKFPDPDCIHRLSDEEKNFRPLKPGSGVGSRSITK